MDEELLEAAGAEFFSVGDRMECSVDGFALEAVLALMMQSRGYALAAYEQREAARAMLGRELPLFTEVEVPVPAVPESLPASTLVSVDTFTLEEIGEDETGAEQADTALAPSASCRAEDSTINEQSEASDVTSSDVYTWACAVRDLGLEPEQRQRRISELTAASHAGQKLELSRYIRQQMQADLEQYRPYQERGQALLQTVRLLVAQGGQLDIWGGVTFKHKRYECVQFGDNITVQQRTGSKTEVILQANGDDIQRTTVKAKDVEQFAELAEELHLFSLHRISAEKKR